MGRVGNKNGVPLLPLPARLMISLYEHQAGHFAMRSRYRLKADLIESGNLFENVLNTGQHFDRARDRPVRLHRMDEREPWESSRPLVDLRVVFHRARAQRIETSLDAVVDVTEIREVAKKIEFPNFWKI